MKALCWHGKRDIRVDNVPDPGIVNSNDAIIKVTSTAICGSDLHIYNHYVKTMQDGDVLGHEFMGEVVEVGRGVKNLKKGDRVVVPFAISCGSCFFCKKEQYSLCDNSNPNGWLTEKMFGQTAGALFGYSHAYGGYSGGQAEYVRVPYADVGPMKVPDDLTDEQVLFLSDIFPTGYMAAVNADIQPGDTVAVWGCGPVGLFTINSALMLGAGRVIAIDRIPERLQLARDKAGAEVLNYEHVDDVPETLIEMTGGHGPDACIDAVGLEAHGTSIGFKYENMKQQMHLQMDRPHVLREMIKACRKGGNLSIPGVYIGYVDKFPLGQVFGKALTIKCGQTFMHKYMRELLPKVQSREIDPSYIITHRLPLTEGPQAYETFCNKEDRCVKVVLKPT